MKPPNWHLGIQAIADALRKNDSLTSVSLLKNEFDDETVAMLLKLKEEKPNLTTLCGLEPEQKVADFKAWSLTAQDAMLLAPEIAASKSLTSLNLSMNNLCGLHELFGTGTYTTKGVVAIAEALRINKSLTKLNVSNNGLKEGKNGVEIFKDVVEKRAGFVLNPPLSVSQSSPNS